MDKDLIIIKKVKASTDTIEATIKYIHKYISTLPNSMLDLDQIISNIYNGEEFNLTNGMGEGIIIHPLNKNEHTIIYNILKREIELKNKYATINRGV